MDGADSKPGCCVGFRSSMGIFWTEIYKWALALLFLTIVVGDLLSQSSVSAQLLQHMQLQQKQLLDLQVEVGGSLLSSLTLSNDKQGQEHLLLCPESQESYQLSVQYSEPSGPLQSPQQVQSPQQQLTLVSQSTFKYHHDQHEQWFGFRSSLLSSTLGSSNSGSLKAIGKIYDSLEWLDDLELRNNTLRLLIMEEPLNFESFGYLAPAFALLRYFIPFSSGFSKSIHENIFGLLVKHDSVIIEYDGGKWIKAEKGGESEAGKNDGGIKLMTVENSEAPENWQDEGDTGPGRYRERFSTGVIDLGKGKVKWFLKQFRQLLSADDPDYNAASANCWRYAFRSAKGVLEWAIENTQSEAAQDALKKKLEELATLERLMPVVVARVIAVALALVIAVALALFGTKTRVLVGHN